VAEFQYRYLLSKDAVETQMAIVQDQSAPYPLGGNKCALCRKSLDDNFPYLLYMAGPPPDLCLCQRCAKGYGHGLILDIQQLAAS
jgi:hypothetical protein